VIVVADTSPLSYLLLIECADILPGLFSIVLIPEAVRAELLSSGAPNRVRAWMEEPPQWLQIRKAPSVAASQFD
jgi:predicted nucleic acid-binding protein